MANEVTTTSMEGKNVEDSDSDDPDFVVELENSSDESVTSECENGVNKCTRQKKSGIKNTSKADKSVTNDKQILVSNFANNVNKYGIQIIPAEDNERTDLLWKSFLNDTDPPATPSNNSIKDNSNPPTGDSKTSEVKISQKDSSLEFSEEKNSEIMKKNDFIQTKQFPYTSNIKSQLLSQQHNNLKKRGLSTVLSSISKKSKLNTLEKSKQDWNQFKQEHNLNEEMKNFNRGKNGYLERQDFLQRTDSRQFEIEKELRISGRRKAR